MVLVRNRLKGGKFVCPLERDGVIYTPKAHFAFRFGGEDLRLVRPRQPLRSMAIG